MDNEKTAKKPGIFGKIGALWKSGVKGKVICIVGVLVILGIIGAFTDDEEGGGGGGGGGDFKISDQSFCDAFVTFAKDEGVVYKHSGLGLYVLQATKKGNLVEYRSDYIHIDRVVWVETKRRYEDDEMLDQGYYIRRGSMEYTTALGAEKTVARYVEVTDKKMLEKIEEMEAKEKAEEEAREAKEKAEEEARKAKKKAEKEAREAKRKAEEEARKAARESTVKALAVEGTRAGETKVITLPGGVQMEMVWCPAGTFLMGSPEDNETRQHRVTLTRGFWMAKTEVTQAQWKSVMGKNPSTHEGDNLPVEEVSWDDCQTFCQDTGLRLPTEAEWEYACRAGTTGDYGGTGSLDDMGWYDANSGRETHPVEQKQPNAWGLYDMHGNVEEWCADWYSQYPSGSVTDPKGDSSGATRVTRGGRWFQIARYCRSVSRSGHSPFSTEHYLGFRPVSILSE